MLIGGKIEIYRKIKEAKEQAEPDVKKIEQSLQPRQEMKELTNVFGDLLVCKDITQESPFKIGEENVLLGISNTCTYVAKSFVPMIEIDQDKFFGLIQDIGLNTIR